MPSPTKSLFLPQSFPGYVIGKSLNATSTVENGTTRNEIQTHRLEHDEFGAKVSAGGGGLLGGLGGGLLGGGDVVRSDAEQDPCPRDDQSWLW